VSFLTPVTVAALALGPKWYNVITKRMQFRAKQTQYPSQLNAKLLAKLAKAAQ
jgi:hypothetical protein